MCNLYEKKLATYPRTDSQYLTARHAGNRRFLILWLRDNMTFGKGYAGEPDIDRVTDDSKVTQPHAIIPTAGNRTDNETCQELPSGERDVPACRQTALCAACQSTPIEAVTAILDCQGYTFLRQKERLFYSPAGKSAERIHMWYQAEVKRSCEHRSPCAAGRKDVSASLP